MSSSCESLVSWALGNSSVEESRSIFLDQASPDRLLTKRDVRRLVRQLICGLRRENNGQFLQGEAICVNAFNDIMYPVIFLGVIGAGGRFAGANPAYTAHELEHHFRLSRTKFIITEEDQLARVSEAASRCGIPAERIFVLPVGSSEVSQGRPWQDLFQHGESDWVAFSNEEQADDTIAGLFSTSGTTGLPKMAARSHKSFIEESASIYKPEGKDYQESRLISIPMFHAFAAPLCQVSAVRYGVPTYIMRRFSEESFLAAVEQHQITETAVVPPMVAKFLSGEVQKKSKQMESLRLVLCAGAHLDSHVQEKAAQTLLSPVARISQVWGMTECGWISTFFYPEVDNTGSVGRFLPGYSFKIDGAENGREIDAASVGEICVKSRTLMRGYLDNPKATSESIDEEGWLHTGDLGRVLDGKVYIVDRKKELIKVRGWQVSPAEIEGTLLQHPSIADAGVVGMMGDQSSGEEFPCAHVVLHKDQPAIGETEVKEFLYERLARYKVADCKVVFSSAIPRNPSGKILRRLLSGEKQPVNQPASRKHPSTRLARFMLHLSWGKAFSKMRYFFSPLLNTIRSWRGTKTG